MGLDDLVGSTSSSGSSSSKGGGGGGRGRQTNKLDFSQPYIRIIRDQNDNISSEIAHSRILYPGDDPENDYYEVLCTFQNELDWKNFKAKAEKELGIDVDEVVEKNPGKIPEMRVQLTKPDPHVPTRSCVVCGEDLRIDRKPFRELKLARDGQAHKGADRVAVCGTHTIDELMTAHKDD